MGGSKNGAVRVVVADDHPSIRENLRYILNAEDDIEVVGVARDGPEAIDAVLATGPDVLVVDDDMPLLEGRGVIARLAREAPDVRVVMYTADVAACEAARAAGAFTCVMKDSAADVLIGAVREAAGVAHRR